MAKELAEVIASNTPAKAKWMEWAPNHPIPTGTDIFINATSIGLHPDCDQKPDVDYSTVTSSMVVSDVVFNPAETRFLKACAAQGAKTVNGLGMLACQGALNFTLWTGVSKKKSILSCKSNNKASI